MGYRTEGSAVMAPSRGACCGLCCLSSGTESQEPEDGGQEESRGPLPASAGPAPTWVTWVSREIDVQAPALLSGCSLSQWLWPVYPTRSWGGAGVMRVGSSLGQEPQGPASSLLALQLT